MSRHMSSCLNERNFECPLCAMKFSRNDTMNDHVRTVHLKEKLYVCALPGCGESFSKQDNLNAHVGGHMGTKYPCLVCGEKFPSKRAVTTHVDIEHKGLNYSCDFPGCEYETVYKQNLKSHVNTIHSIEGQIRQKKQENRVNKLLKEWGHTVDCEVTINAARNGCVEDSQRHFSRIDFSIINCVNAMLILEVDEDQHYWYNLSCEFSRMSDIRAALVKAGYELPIYWIRYNPQGKYHVASEQVKTYRSKREIELKKHLEELCSPDFVPKNQVNIHYMYYDLISETEGPELVSDDDFPEALKGCVTWCI